MYLFISYSISISDIYKRISIYILCPYSKNTLSAYLVYIQLILSIYNLLHSGIFEIWVKVKEVIVIIIILIHNTIVDPQKVHNMGGVQGISTTRLRTRLDLCSLANTGTPDTLTSKTYPT